MNLPPAFVHSYDEPAAARCGFPVAMLDRLLQDAYQSHGPAVLGYLRSRLADTHDCEELLQQTFVVIAEDPAAFRAAASKRAWLIGIARNLLREHYRRSRRVMQPLGDDEPPVLAAPVDDRIELVRLAIVELPAGQREVLHMRLRDELSYAEIAEALNLPVGTVRSRIHHAVAALRRRFESPDPPPAQRDPLAAPRPHGERP